MSKNRPPFLSPPSRLVPLVLGLVFMALSAVAGFAQTPPFTRTVVVNATSNPTTNGTNLINAVLNIPTPTSPNRAWLVKVEPGVFDLGGRQIVMRDFVDIEGSGRDVTQIVSDISNLANGSPTILVPADITAELRELTVRNTSIDRGIGVFVVTDHFLMDEVNVEIETAGDGIGVSIGDFSPRLNEIFVRMNAGGDDTGLLLGGGTVVTDSLVFIASSGNTNIAVDVDGSDPAILDQLVAFSLLGDVNYGVRVSTHQRPEITDTRVTASGGADARGLYIRQGAGADVKESTFTAWSDSLAIGLSLDNSSVTTSESTYRARSINIDHLSVFALRLEGLATSRANQSTFDSWAFAVTNTGSNTAFFGASQLVGQTSSSSPTGLQCVFSYSGSYTTLNSQCL